LAQQRSRGWTSSQAQQNKITEEKKKAEIQNTFILQCFTEGHSGMIVGTDL
jgi:hypothetical protein